MEEMILDEVRRDVFENPKPTIDLDYLYSVKKQIQDFADETNAQLKKNVYQNYSLFIESSREISTLKDDMKQLNTLLESQQISMNKLLDQLKKNPIVQPTLERPKLDPYRLEMSPDDTSEVEEEILPSWFIKSPEEFDVLIAQRNLKEAVELTQRVKAHLAEYPKCCENQPDLKVKVDLRIQELIHAICSELQPATDRSVQGGPRSSVMSIRLLRELNLSSKAVKLYLDQRTLVLRFVLDQQKVESNVQFIKQYCSIFYYNLIETCTEFKQAFDLEKDVNKALEESSAKLVSPVIPSGPEESLLFDSVRPIYYSSHPPINSNTPATSYSASDISSHMLSHNATDKGIDVISKQTLTQAGLNHLNNHNNISNSGPRAVFYNLATYASLTFWVLEEFENFTIRFKKHVFNNPQLSNTVIAECLHHLRNQCSKLASFCEIDMSKSVDITFEKEIRKLIEDSGKSLLDLIDKLANDETWLPQQFQNKTQLTRFFEEMNEVELKTMPSYVFEDLKLRFTASKTRFARHFLVTVTDLAKLVNAANKEHIDSVLAKAFEAEMETVVDALKKAKVASKSRFIMGNSNFLLDKVILVAEAQYSRHTSGLICQRLADLRAKYQAKVKAESKL